MSMFWQENGISSAFWALPTPSPLPHRMKPSCGSASFILVFLCVHKYTPVCSESFIVESAQHCAKHWKISWKTRQASDLRSPHTSGEDRQ